MNRYGFVILMMTLATLGSACSPASQQVEVASLKATGTSGTGGTGSNGGTGGATDCKARFETFAAGQLEWYRARTSYLPIQKIRSVYSQGTNGHAVVVVHGYNSSPLNQRDLILSLSLQGYTVIAPLLTGYGVDAVTSNKATFNDWQKSVEDAVAVVQPCHSKVSLVGHSFGASLVTNIVSSGRLKNIAKVVSLAPFYKASRPELNAAVSYLSANYPTMSTTTLAMYVDASSYEFMIGGEKGEADPSLPMLALQTVFNSQSLFASTAGMKSATPMLLVVSHDDMVINNVYAVDYVKAKYSKTTTVAYDAALEIGHSFQRRENNPRFDELVGQIAAHLSAP